MRTSLRLALVIASIVVVASSTSALAALSEANAGAAGPSLVTTEFATLTPIEPRTLDAAPVRIARTPTAAERSHFPDGYCPEVPQVRAATIAIDPTGSCVIAGEHEPQGTIRVVPGTDPAAAADRVIRFRIEIEDGLAVDPACFSAAVTSTLTDDRGWGGTGALSFERVDDEYYDFRLILASPGTTDSLCYPAATGGKYSCRNKDKVVLNLMRWESGTDDFTGKMNVYREYLVNHEVGHLLGEGHRSCPGPGLPAPVMMQQTKGVGECTPNGWPTTDER